MPTQHRPYRYSIGIALYCLGFLMGLWPIPIWGQTSLQPLRSFQLPDMQSDSEILSILEDSDGFMWFGTNVGLYRSDGTDFTSYRREYNNPNSLPDNEVYSLMQDSEGRLWIGTKSGGVSLLDLDTGNFKHYRDSSQGDGVPDNYFVSTIFQDQNGDIWLTSNGRGLAGYQPSTDSFHYFQKDEDNPKSIRQNNPIDIAQGPDGKLWVGLNGGGLELFDPEREEFSHYSATQNSDTRINFRNNVVRDVAQLDADRLLLATYGGLLVLRIQDRQYRHFSAETENPLKTTSFNSIASLGESHLITSYEGYIYEVGADIDLPSLVHKTEDPIRTSFIDGNNRLWLGFTGGKVTCYQTENRFDFHNAFDDRKNEVWSVLKDGSKLYFGTANGLFVVQGGHSSLLLPNKDIYTMAKDKEGLLWLGTNTEGVIVYDPDTGVSIDHKYVPGNKDGLQHDTIMDIYCDDMGVIWVCTAAGISQWIPESGIFKTMGYSTFYNALRLDQDILWAASGLGIAIVNLETEGFFMKRSSLEQHRDSIMHNEVRSLFTPDRDSVLIGTKDGLNLFVRSTDTMLDVHPILSLPYMTFKNILQDSYGNYWANTSKGLLHFNLGAKKYRFWGINEGLHLPNRFFGQNVHYDHKANKLILGGFGGYYAFTPPATVEDPQRIDAQITRIQINNGIDLQKADTKATPSVHAPALDYDENTVTFDFVGIHYPDPNAVRYRYRLNGQKEQWLITDKKSVTYANLGPGDYSFEVDAALNGKFLTANPSVFNFSINPPLWATWWAYLGYFVTLFGLLYYLFRTFLTQQKLKTQWHLEHLEAEKAKEISAIKSRFFANVSHEFRTPLTLIKGPVEDLLGMHGDHDTKKSLRLIQRNVTRLQQLIHQLLDYSKISDGRIPVKKEEQEVFGFLRSISSSFVSYAQTKNVLYQVAIPMEKQVMLIDSIKVETILNNLISNAIKFTPEGGTVVVSAALISMSKEEHQLQLAVTDTASGLNTKQKDQVFDRYFRLHPDMEGMGIGLALTKELVESLEGTITIKDNEPKGSIFEVRLPTSLRTAHAEHPKIREDAKTTGEDKALTQHGQTILLVEDNMELQNYVKHMLAPYGKILQAVNGESGLKIAQREVPDLIISDYMMPGMDGGAVCRAIRSHVITSHIPLIMLTAKATDQDKIAGLVDGATDYIFKPFDRNELIYKVQNILGERMRLQEHLAVRLFLDGTSETIRSQDERFLDKFKKLVEQHRGNSDLSVTFLGQQLGMSRVQLYRKLMAITGMSATDLVRKLRLQHAATLIKKGWGNVSQVAFEVGFNNLSYFSRSFKDEFGTSPSQYGKQDS